MLPDVLCVHITALGYGHGNLVHHPPAAHIRPTGARFYTSAETSLFSCIYRSANVTHGSVKSPVTVTTPQEEDRLSAPDSASPASTPTGESLPLLHELAPHHYCWLSTELNSSCGRMVDGWHAQMQLPICTRAHTMSCPTMGATSYNDQLSVSTVKWHHGASLSSPICGPNGTCPVHDIQVHEMGIADGHAGWGCLLQGHALHVHGSIMSGCRCMCRGAQRRRGRPGAQVHEAGFADWRARGAHARQRDAAAEAPHRRRPRALAHALGWWVAPMPAASSCVL